MFKNDFFPFKKNNRLIEKKTVYRCMLLKTSINKIMFLKELTNVCASTENEVQPPQLYKDEINKTKLNKKKNALKLKNNLKQFHTFCSLEF